MSADAPRPTIAREALERALHEHRNIVNGVGKDCGCASGCEDPWPCLVHKLAEAVLVALSEAEKHLQEIVDREWRFVRTDSDTSRDAEAALSALRGQAICGRVLVGRGSDVSDPLCVLPRGHSGGCEQAALRGEPGATT